MVQQIKRTMSPWEVVTSTARCCVSPVMSEALGFSRGGDDLCDSVNVFAITSICFSPALEDSFTSTCFSPVVDSSMTSISFSLEDSSITPRYFSPVAGSSTMPTYLSPVVDMVEKGFVRRLIMFKHHL